MNVDRSRFLLLTAALAASACNKGKTEAKTDEKAQTDDAKKAAADDAKKAEPEKAEEPAEPEKEFGIKGTPPPEPDSGALPAIEPEPESDAPPPQRETLQ